MCNENDFRLAKEHPRRTRGSHSGPEKRRDESFPAQAEEPLNTDSHQTIPNGQANAGSRLGTKKSFVLLCPIDEQPSDCPWVPEDGQSRASKGLYVKNEADI